MDLWSMLNLSNDKQSALIFTGLQYINTEFIPNQDTRVVFECSIDTYNYLNTTYDNRPLFGARVGTIDRTYMFWQTVQGSTAARTAFNNANVDIARNIVPFDTRLIIDKNKNITYINGVAVATQAYVNFTPGIPLFVGGMNNNGSIYQAGYGFIGKGFNIQIYDNGILVRNLIAVQQGSTQYSPIPAPSNCYFDKCGSISAFTGNSYYVNRGMGTIGFIMI